MQRCVEEPAHPSPIRKRLRLGHSHQEESRGGKEHVAGQGEVEGWLGQSRQIPRGEFIRLLEQALMHLGFEDLSSELQARSGFSLMEAAACLFRQAVLNERWDEAVQLLQRLPVTCSLSRRRATFLLLQNKFLQLVLARDTAAALKTLRKELAPLGVEQEQLHQLAGCLLPGASLPSFATLGDEEGSGGERVLACLPSLIPPDILLPENRLEELVEQALEAQMARCRVGGVLPANDGCLTLLADLEPFREALLVPDTTVACLRQHTDEVWHLVFSPSGRYLASASKDCTASIWEVDTSAALPTPSSALKHLRSLKGHSGCVCFVCWAPDDSLLATCSHDKTLRLWDPKSGDCVAECVGHKGPVTSASWVPSGHRLISASHDTTFKLWNLRGIACQSFSLGKQAQHLLVTGDGSHLVFTDGTAIRILNILTRVEQVVGRLSESVLACCLSADGRHLLCNVATQDRVCLVMWDIGRFLGDSHCVEPRPRHEPVAQYSATGYNTGRYVVRGSFAGRREELVVSGFEDSKVHIWQRSTGTHLAALVGHTGTVNCVAWHPTQPCLLASASDDQTIRIWSCLSPPPR